MTINYKCDCGSSFQLNSTVVDAENPHLQCPNCGRILVEGKTKARNFILAYENMLDHSDSCSNYAENNGRFNIVSIELDGLEPFDTGD